MDPMIYLFFKGDCREAMQFYAETLGGEPGGIFRNGDAPDPESRMPGDDDLVLNMSMRLGSTTIMASDNSDSMYATPQGFRVSISPPSLADFERIFAAFSQGARAIEMAPARTFWAERFAMLTDRYGTPWMLSYEGDAGQAAPATSGEQS